MSETDSAEGKEIWFINRSVVVLRPKGPFVRWVIKTSGQDHPPSREFIESASSAFLLPDFESDGEAQAWLQENCSILFELMLADWYEAPDTWPENREWSVFRDWFRIEHIDTAWDLVDEPLSSDPPQPLKDSEGG
jgi:hypothetical protein